jgi:hypothetical protein
MLHAAVSDACSPGIAPEQRAAGLTRLTGVAHAPVARQMIAYVFRVDLGQVW